MSKLKTQILSNDLHKCVLQSEKYVRLRIGFLKANILEQKDYIFLI